MRAYIYCCFDPKVWPRVVEIFNAKFGDGNYFLDLDPGAMKNISSPKNDSDRNFVLYKIQVALNLHPFKKLILINHSNCGAYHLAGITFTSEEEEHNFHKTELEKAIKFLEREFPNLEIETHFFLKDKNKLVW